MLQISVGLVALAGAIAACIVMIRLRCGLSARLRKSMAALRKHEDALLIAEHNQLVAKRVGEYCEMLIAEDRYWEATGAISALKLMRKEGPK